MKLKMIIISFCLLTVLTALTGLYMYYDSIRQAAFSEDRIVAASHVESIEQAISSMVSQYFRIALSLSRHAEMTALLADTGDRHLQRANALLDLYHESLRTEVCYLVNYSGVAIASSNRNDADSFVGKSYAFRPYFKNAIKGLPFAYMALGVTSGRRGIYFSSPVYQSPGTAPSGVVVIKEDVGKLERDILVKHYTPQTESRDFVFVVNGDGVIFITDRPEYRFQTVWPLKVRAARRIAASQQFGAGPWPWAGFKKTGEDTVIDPSGRHFNIVVKHIREFPDWQVIHLSDTDALLAGIHNTFFRTAGIVFLFVLFIIGSVLVLLTVLANKAEKQLRESEARHRLVMETVNEGIILQAATGEILTWNKGAEAIFGIGAEEIVGQDTQKRDWPTIHVDGSRYDAKDHPSMKTLQTGKPCRNELMGVRSPDGAVRWISINTNPLFREKGRKPHAVVISFSDITAVKKEKDLSQQYLDVAGVMLLALNARGEIMLVNKKACEILESSEAALLGMNWFDHFLPPGMVGDVKKIFNNLMRGMIAVEEYAEHPIITRSGQEKIIAWHNSILKNEKGEICGTLSSGEDITGRKKMEVQLQQAQKMESIGNLAGGIAHDFNNILFPIIGMSELLLEDLPHGSQEFENAEVIFQAAKRGGDLVKHILAFSRQSEHKLIPIRIQQTLREVLRLTRATLPADVEIEQEIQNDCGLILADATQIHQVAMNVITNAYHAVEPGVGKISVRLRETALNRADVRETSLQPGRYVLLSISDNGCGMPPGVMAKIFEPYFTTKEQGKGTGLGLAVAYGIIKEHGGDIKLYSDVGKGSTFDIYLPLMDKQAATVIPEEIGQAYAGTERILFVDDEDSIVKLGKQMLERLGYAVTTRVNSVEALEAFKAKPDAFDLIISDMTMPMITGDQLAREVKRIRPDLPIIICTGFSERLNAETVRGTGVNGFLMKPIVKAELARTVRNVLDGHEMMAETSESATT